MPTDLAVIYPLWNIDTGDLLAWSYLVAAVAVAALLWVGCYRLGRGPLAGAVFFAVALSPTLGFVDYGYMRLSLVADRYAYLAGIGGISVLIGAAAYGAGKLPNILKIGASGVLVVVLAVFGRLTWEQAGVYRDELSFYNHIISLNPVAISAHWGRVNALIDAQRPAEALTASRVAVKQFPGDARVHNTRGVALLAMNRLDEAARSFRRALELDSNHKKARQNMGETRRRQGRFVESIRWYRGVLDIDPDLAPAHAGMGAALFRLGDYEQAAQSLAQGVSLRPDALPIGAFQLLADALHRQQRHEEAIETYRDVLKMDPDYVPAHAGTGYALLRLKRYEEAVESLARAISLQPESPEAADRHVAMGRASQALGRTEAAAERYERALEIDARNAKALDSFAVLRFRQQRYEEAIRLYETLTENGEANAQVHANMGATLYHPDRRDEALRSLDRALSLDPTLARTGFQEMRDALRRERQ